MSLLLITIHITDKNSNFMKHIFLFLSLILVSVCTMAQKNEKNYEHRSEHISQILGLDDTTTAHFNAVYEKYRQEMRNARQTYAKVRGQKTKGQAPVRLTDEQVRKNIENSFALSQNILDIRKKYYKEYLKILTPRQIERLYDLEKKNGEHVREMVQKRQKRK